MKIALYVQEIEHAATTILNALWAEVKRFKELDAEVKKLERVVEYNYQQSRAWEESEDPEDVAMGAGIFCQTYFDEDKERHHKTQDRDQLKQQITVHRFSMDSLAGSLLQFGKQGISLAYSSPDKTPKRGRMIGSQRLPDVIWHGRNQSVHWEDVKIGNKTDNCYRLLKNDICKKFADFENRNQGFHLVGYLGWSHYEKFKADLLSLE